MSTHQEQWYRVKFLVPVQLSKGKVSIKATVFFVYSLNALAAIDKALDTIIHSQPKRAARMPKNFAFYESFLYRQDSQPLTPDLVGKLERALQLCNIPLCQAQQLGIEYPQVARYMM